MKEIISLSRAPSIIENTLCIPNSISGVVFDIIQEPTGYSYNFGDKTYKVQDIGQIPLATMHKLDHIKECKKNKYKGFSRRFHIEGAFARASVRIIDFSITKTEDMPGKDIRYMFIEDVFVNEGSRGGNHGRNLECIINSVAKEHQVDFITSVLDPDGNKEKLKQNKRKAGYRIYGGSYTFKPLNNQGLEFLNTIFE